MKLNQSCLWLQNSNSNQESIVSRPREKGNKRGNGTKSELPFEQIAIKSLAYRGKQSEWDQIRVAIEKVL